jgi:hypothetical protein
MNAKQQRGNRSVVNHGARLGRKEGFWPFDDFPIDPEDPNPGGPKSSASDPTGDDSGYPSIKNYPSSTRGPVEKR